MAYRYDPDHDTHNDACGHCYHCGRMFLDGCDADAAYCSQECLEAAAEEIREDERARREVGR